MIGMISFHCDLIFGPRFFRWPTACSPSSGDVISCFSTSPESCVNVDPCTCLVEESCGCATVTIQPNSARKTNLYNVDRGNAVIHTIYFRRITFLNAFSWLRGTARCSGSTGNRANPYADRDQSAG